MMVVMVVVIIIIIISKSAKIFNMGSNIICTINCDYRIPATLHTLEKWFVFGI